jgi:hypothetical protein
MRDRGSSLNQLKGDRFEKLKICKGQQLKKDFETRVEVEKSLESG